MRTAARRPAGRSDRAVASISVISAPARLDGGRGVNRGAARIGLERCRPFAACVQVGLHLAQRFNCRRVRAHSLTIACGERGDCAVRAPHLAHIVHAEEEPDVAAASELVELGETSGEAGDLGRLPLLRARRAGRPLRSARRWPRRAPSRRPAAPRAGCRDRPRAAANRPAAISLASPAHRLPHGESAADRRPVPERPGRSVARTVRPQ